MKDYFRFIRNRSHNLRGKKIKFIRSNHKGCSEDLLIITGTGVISGAVVGGGIGAVVGGTCGLPGGPPGIVGGAIIGATVGATIGGIIGGAIAVGYTYPKYKEWLKTEAGKQFGGQLKAFLADYDTIDLMCAITSEVPIDPVRTPQGQIYERKEIVAWINKHGTDPMTREPLTEQDLIEDSDAPLKATRQIQAIIEHDEAYLQKHAPELVPGLHALNKDMQCLCNDVYYKKLKNLDSDFRHDSLTPKEYRDARTKLEQQYRID